MQSQRIDNTVQLVQGLETFSPSSLLQNECSPSLSEYPSNHAQTFKTHNFWHLKSLVSLYDGGILFDPGYNCSYGQYRQQLSAGSLPLFVRSCSSCGIGRPTHLHDHSISAATLPSSDSVVAFQSYLQPVHECKTNKPSQNFQSMKFRLRKRGAGILDFCTGILSQETVQLVDNAYIPIHILCICSIICMYIPGRMHGYDLLI